MLVFVKCARSRFNANDGRSKELTSPELSCKVFPSSLRVVSPRVQASVDCCGVWKQIRGNGPSEDVSVVTCPLRDARDQPEEPEAEQTSEYPPHTLIQPRPLAGTTHLCVMFQYSIFNVQLGQYWYHTVP